MKRYTHLFKIFYWTHKITLEGSHSSCPENKFAGSSCMCAHMCACTCMHVCACVSRSSALSQLFIGYAHCRMVPESWDVGVVVGAVSHYYRGWLNCHFVNNQNGVPEGLWIHILLLILLLLIKQKRSAGSYLYEIKGIIKQLYLQF